VDGPEAAAHTAPVRAARIPVARVAAVALLASALGAAGCGGGARPDTASWQARWRAARELVPPTAAFRVEDPRPLCGRVLRELKSARGRLLPAPSDVLERAAGAWLDFAEALMFDCPLREGPHAGFDAGFVELQRLAVEVEAELAYEGGSPVR
jgi:hypothetical protein